MKDLLILIACILAIALATYYRRSVSRERMTNKDLISALQKFGDQSGDSSKKSDTLQEAPIYGPKAAAPSAPFPAPSKKSNSDGTSSDYPEIYGPDVAMTPGTGSTCTKDPPGTHASDSATSEDCTYQYNPDLKKAFPTDGKAPQPFLTDFSKFSR
jgi:hypothetical protein